MNPLRYARLLAGAFVLLSAPHALSAQNPCDAKKAYDAAKKKADDAATELNKVQKQHGNKTGKPAGDKAKLQADLLTAQTEAGTADQLLKEAETAVIDAEKEMSKFDAAADKGKRLTALGGLIAKHKADITKAKQDLAAKQTVIDQLAKAKTEVTTAENDVKGKLKGLDPADLDAAKLQADADVAQFEKAYQANQPPAPTLVQRLTGNTPIKAEGDLPTVTTAMSCPAVVEAQRIMGVKQATRDKLHNDVLNVDQNASNAAGQRAELMRKIDESEKGIAADLTTLRTTVQNCQKEVQAGLKAVDSKRTAVLLLDPGSKIQDQQEALKKLEADNALETESTRLTAEQKTLSGLVSSAKANVLTYQAGKTKADGLVEELQQSITLATEEEALGKVKPDYDNVEKLKNIEVKTASDDLAAAKQYLDDLAEVKKQVAEYKKLKAQVPQDKVAFDAAKAKLVALLQTKGWKGDKNRSVKLRICDTKDAHKQALANRKAALDPYKCFQDAADKMTEIDTRTKALGAEIRRAPTSVLALWPFAGWSRKSRGGAAAALSAMPSAATLLAALDCSMEDAMLEEDLEALDQESTEEPTDSVPGDVTSGTGAVKVPRYFVFLLTNASNGLYVGDEDELKKLVRCGFEGGGINCKPTDLVTYKKLHGPFPTQADAQSALCKSITETRYFPLGIGLKGRWQGSNTWYGLWAASVSGCPK